MLSDTRIMASRPFSHLHVLMHLMALGAFRLQRRQPHQLPAWRLNAPYGARCFPTRQHALPQGHRRRVLMHLMALGAFRQVATSGDLTHFGPVLMHLMALGAFRLRRTNARTWCPPWVLMHLMALGAFRQSYSSSLNVLLKIKS